MLSAPTPKDKIEAFIHANIVGYLPCISPSRVRHTVYARPFIDEFKQELICATLMVQFIQAFTEVIRQTGGVIKNCSEYFGFIAFLVKRFRNGNCSEQAAFAARQLADCEEIKQLYFIIDKKNDHAYLKIIQNDDTSLFYDPWLIAGRLFTQEEYLKASEFISITTPELDEYPIEKSGIKADFSLPLILNLFSATLKEIMSSPPPAIEKRSATDTATLELVPYTRTDFECAKTKCQLFFKAFLREAGAESYCLE